MPEQMSVAVTGARGFIGRSTVEHLRRAGHFVRGFDRSQDVLDASNFALTPGSDITTADLVTAFDGCGAVVHLAGVLGTSELFDDLENAINVNIHGTRRVLEACHKTGARYVGIAVPDCWPSAYQATKLAAQRMADAYANATGMTVKHVKAFNVFGPGQAYGPGHPQKIIPTFASLSWAGEPMPIWGDGTQTVDLVYVDDVAAVLTQAATCDVAWTVAEAGTGQEITVTDVARMVGKVTGCSLVEYLPMRAGELPYTRIKAETPRAPFRRDRLDETILSYKP